MPSINKKNTSSVRNLQVEIISAPTGPSDRCARYSRTSAVSRAIIDSRRQRLWCEKQCRIVKEQTEDIFARLAAKKNGYWQTNEDGSKTLIPHEQSGSSPADMKSAPSLSESLS
jgi:hypothetical protein